MGNFVDVIKKPFEIVGKTFGTTKGIVSKASLSSCYLCAGCVIILLTLPLNRIAKTFIICIYLLLGIILFFWDDIRKHLGHFTVQQQKAFQKQPFQKKPLQKKQEKFTINKNAENAEEEEHSEEFQKMINTNPDTISTIFKDSFEYPNNREQFAQWVYGPNKADRFVGI